MRRIVFVLITFCMMMGSCSSKMDPINELTALSEEIDANGNNYSNEDWSNSIQQYDMIEQELDHNSYTDEEQKDIGRLKARLDIRFYTNNE